MTLVFAVIVVDSYPHSFLNNIKKTTIDEGSVISVTSTPTQCDVQPTKVTRCFATRQLDIVRSCLVQTQPKHCRSTIQSRLTYFNLCMG
jgi:hypothetical protein